VEGQTTKGIWPFEKEIIVNTNVVIPRFFKVIQNAYHYEWVYNRWGFYARTHNLLWNKKLAWAQLRWPTHEKELFVIVSCLKAWQYYLGSHKSKVFMDNAFS
jgi:hypothetical protein